MIKSQCRVILKPCLGLVVLAALAPIRVQADGFNFITINDPADNALETPAFNQLLGINNSGVIAGYYGDGVIVNNHGFTYNGAFTPENVAGADQTQVVAINNVMTGGAYQTAGFSVINASGVNTGFTNSGGTFTAVNGPGSTFTQVLGLNDHSQAAGFFVSAGGMTSGFTYNTTTTTVTPLVVPSSWNATSVTATGINNSGTVVGFFSNCTGCVSGFIDNGGTFSTPTDPLGTNPMFFGINNLGEIVGTDTTAGGYSEGFVLDMTSGTWTPVFDPNAQKTADGFGISGTTLNGINDLGQLVGFYADVTGNVDGVLVNPTPEPASLGLIGFGCLLGFGVLMRRRRRTN